MATTARHLHYTYKEYLAMDETLALSSIAGRVAMDDLYRDGLEDASG